MKQFSNIATACGVERHIRLNEGMTTSAQIRVLAENNPEVYGQSDLFNFFIVETLRLAMYLENHLEERLK